MDGKRRFTRYKYSYITNKSSYKFELVQNVNGQLIHYISSNVEGNTGSKRSIGRAPSFMINGVKYYSYDEIIL